MCELGNVQQKIPCIFQTVVVPNVSSAKRADQSYRIEASGTLRSDASHLICQQSSQASEKVDGTCVLVKDYCGRLWIWARHDRKPNKAAEKRFRKFQHENPQLLAMVDGDHTIDRAFQWDVANDFKDVPPDWIPSTNAVSEEGTIFPDANGYIMGWIPIDPKSRQHCWHSSIVDLNNGLALVLRPPSEKPRHLEITLQPLAELSECTLELIGTNINGNPYRLGTKQNPVHLLVRHGIIPFDEPPPVDFVDLKDWFQTNCEGGVEGIVWHCSSRKMFKLHRHHLKLEWPRQNLRLLSRPVNINAKYETKDCSSQLIRDVCRMTGRMFDSLEKINFD